MWPGDDVVSDQLTLMQRQYRCDAQFARIARPVNNVGPLLFDLNEGVPRFNFPIRGDWVYVIVDGADDHRQTYEAMKLRRPGRENPEKLPRINAVSPASVLYVGSSKDSKIRQRLNQHFSQTLTSTYALRLGLWCPMARGRIFLRRYEVAPQVLQLIEDSIAHVLQPSFGKRGGNGLG